MMRSARIPDFEWAAVLPLAAPDRIILVS